MTSGARAPVARRPRVVVVGSANLDTVAEVPRLPAPGETLTASAVTAGCGGKGLNQAIAAARAGGEVAMVAAVGDDGGGRMLVGRLEEDGVVTSGVARVAGAATGVALVTVAPGGVNTIVVGPGANHHLTPEAAVDWSWAEPDVVLVQQEIPPAAVTAALRAGRAAGATTILNPAPAAGPLAPEVLGLVDVLVPNETELDVLAEAGPAPAGAGPDPAGAGPDPERRAVALRRGGCGAVIVTLGGEGALVVAHDTLERIPAFEVEVRDTTGAGDTFCGVLAVELGRGAALAAAARRATAAAALSVTVPGAAASIPAAADVDAFLAERVAPQ